MLGMMNKGGGSTNMPVGGAAQQQLPQQMQAGAMPQPVPGNPANSGMGPMGAGGNPLAALFMGNQPAARTTPPARLPVITQPQRPVVEPPPPPHRPVVQQAAANPLAGMGPIRTRADMLNFMQAHPDRTDVQTNFLRAHNYSNRQRRS